MKNKLQFIPLVILSLILVLSVTSLPVFAQSLNSNFSPLVAAFTDINVKIDSGSQSRAIWGDYDNDGDQDIVQQYYDLNAINNNYRTRIYRNDGGGTFTNINASLTGVNNGTFGWGDYDNDGDLDLLLTGATASTVITKIYRNDGSGVFTDINAGLTGVKQSSVAWGDYDNDGDLDIILAGATGSSNITKIYRNDGSGVFTDINTTITGIKDGTLGWGDYDNDGDLDVFVSGNTTSSGKISRVYRNDGNGTFANAATLTGVDFGSVAWGDYDADGYLDILLTGNSTVKTSKIYRNSGSGTFTDISAGLTGVTNSSVAWADYDNDGDLDALLTGDTGSGLISVIYQNNGSGTFTSTSVGILGLKVTSVSWSDYNNDKKLDILITGNDGTKYYTKVFSNNASVANTAPSTPSGLSSSVSGSTATLTWNKSSDTETPANGLTYNVRFGNGTNGINIITPMANLGTGARRVARLGNANHDTTWKVKNLPFGVYTWSVQAIDNAFEGSSFATEGSVSVNPTISAQSGTNGTISPSGSVMVNYDQSQQFTFTPNNGYHVDSVIVDGVKVDSISSYTFTNVVTTHTIRVTFAINTYTLSVNATNGSVTKNPDLSLYNHGTTVDLTPVPNEGYHFTGWTVDASGTTNPLTVTMDGDKNITAGFAINTYTISATSGNNGVISPTGNDTLDYGSAKSYTFTPATGYHLDSLIVDGVSQPIASSYEFTSISANHTIYVSFAINTYSLNVTAENGSVTKSPDQVVYDSNTTVQLTAVPNSGYHFVKWTGDVNDSTNQVNVTMDADKNVTAVFAINTFTLDVTATNGSVTKNPDLAEYDSSSTVELTAVPDEGYHFVGWTGDVTGTENPATLTMNKNSNVTATFAINMYTLDVQKSGSGDVTIVPEDSLYSHGTSVTLTATAGSGYHFTGWSGDASGTDNPLTVTMNSTKEITATFAINTFTLNVSATNGSVTKNPDLEKYDSSSTVELTAVPDEGYHFTGWSGDATGTENPLTVTMNSNKILTATFAINTYTLDAKAEGNGYVTVSPDTATYDHGTTVTLTAFAGVGYHFVGWSGDATGSENPLSVTMDTSKSITATFAINTYALNITSENGSVTRNPELAEYDSSSTVELTAVPNEGYHFVEWSGDASGTSNPINVTMDADKNITATFAINTYTISLSSGSNGSISPTEVTVLNYGSDQTYTFTPGTGYHVDSVIVDGVDQGAMSQYTFTDVRADHTLRVTFAINTYSLLVNAENGSVSTSPDQVLYDSNTTVELTATPGSGYHFVGWTGDATGTDNPLTITMDANKEVTASFAINTFELSISSTHGSISRNPEASRYDSNTTVELTAIPDDGYHFNGWGGNASGTTNPYNLLMDADKNVSASFAINTYTLGITSEGNGSVSKSPDDTLYEHGTTVSLTAIPGVGYHFVEWSGDATGSDNPLSVTMNGDKSITAVFAINTYTLEVSGLHGSVTKNPSASQYDSNSTVTLTAEADEGYHFVEWTGDATGSSNPLTVTMDGNKSITANFELNEYTITINKTGNGTVTLSPDQATYHYGDVVTITQIADTGWTFAGWSAACTGTSSCVITIDADKTVAATFTQDEYTLTIDKVGNGSVSKSPDQATYHYGDVVTLDANGDAGWSFQGFTGDNTDNLVTMTGNKTVTATFTQDEYTLTINTVGNGNVNKSPDQATYHFGDIVTLGATADTGWTFQGFTGDNTENTVTMYENRSVTATFTQNEYTLTVDQVGNGNVSKSPDQPTYHYGDIVTLDATADTGWTFQGFTGDVSGNTVTITGDMTVSATFTQDEYTLTIEKVGNGSVSKSPDQATYHYGDVVTLSATADAGWTFDGFSGDNSGNTVTMTGDKSVTATFTQDEYTLTINTIGNGTVNKSPDQATYHYGDVVTLQAVPDLGWSFYNGYSGDNDGNTVVMTGNKSVTATFTINQYTLNVTRAGTGSGRVVGDSIDCGIVCTATFDHGTRVTLVAIPSPGSKFTGWTGASTSTNDTIKIPMINFRSVTATFVKEEYTLTIDKVGNGSVSKNPDQATYHYGDVVTLSATADTGWTFDGFSGDNSENTVTMTGDKSVTATFTQDEYTLTIEKVGSGSVSKSPDQTTYHYGDVVTLSATPIEGWSFDGFSGDTATSTTVVMNGNRTVTATFKINRYTLTVVKDGSGTGHVSGSPAGIDCGTTCSADFNYGTFVTLTATASPGSTFAGWSGSGCSGTGTCVVRIDQAHTVTATFIKNEYTLNVSLVGNGTVSKDPDQAIYYYGDVVTLSATADTGWTFDGFSGDNDENTVTMTGNKSVTATFTQDEYTLTVNTVGNGSVSKDPDQATYHYGDVVTLSATADTGWTFSGFTGDNSENTVTMTGNKSVTATFTQDEYTLTIEKVGNGSVSKDPDQATYHYGDVVTLSATADTGWTFDGFSGDNSENTVTMTGNKLVTATFTQDEYTLTIEKVGNGSVSKSPDQATYHYGDVVTLSATADTGWTFDGFTGDNSENTVTMTGNKSVTATFTQDEYTLTIEKVGNGSVSKSPDQATYHYGDVVTLSATADTGWTFDGFSGDNSENTVTMTGNKSVTATFTQDEYTLTIEKVGNGSVGKSPDQATYHYGDVVSLSATADTGWTFDGFSGDNDENTVTMTGNKSVTATFTQDEYTLTIEIVGNGSVSKSPDKATYHYGDVVTLSATADTGWTFSGFTGDNSENTVTMTGNKSVTATFTQDEYTLTIEKVGNGSVSKDPDQATYHYGDVVTLSATADTGWTFDGFSGDNSENTVTMTGNKSVTATFTQDEYTLAIEKVGNGSVGKSPDQATYHYGDVVTLSATADTGWTFDGFSGDNSENTVTMTGNKLVTATFTQDEYTLTIEKVGNGSVSKSPDQATYHYGDVVTLSATADTGWTFSGFSGDNSGNIVTMTGNKSVTATFTQDEYTLTIEKVGNGSVSKSPDQATYHYGDVVILSATADTGWTFSGFTGDNSENTVTMTGNKSVTATFTQDEYTLAIEKVGNGSVGKSPDQATYHYGDVVTLSATAETGWTFDGFSGDNDENTVTMTGNKSVTATFTQDEYTLTIEKVGNGSVSKSPDQATYHYGDVVTLSATADTGWTFDGFTGDNSENTVTMTGNKSVTATFTQDEYTLTINKVGNGSVSKSPDQATYHYGDVVTLSATGDNGWTFAGFTGDISDSIVIMTGNKSVTATFTQDEYTLTVNIVGNGTVSKSPDKATYHYGEVVTLTAVPNNGNHFVVWSTGDENTDSSINVTIYRNKTISAYFERSAPTAVRLLAPLNNTIDSLRNDSLHINFAWSQSTDIDFNENLLYLLQFNIKGAGVDTSVAIPWADTSFGYSGVLPMLPLSNYVCTWTVDVTDGIDTVASPDTFQIVFAKPNAVKGEKEIPEHYSLSQNYPNPFNPSTEIQYALPFESYVVLTVHDMLGKEVSTLVNEVQQAGTISVRWDASSLPSGLYFYRLDATAKGSATNHFSKIRKMLLVK